MIEAFNSQQIVRVCEGLGTPEQYIVVESYSQIEAHQIASELGWFISDKVDENRLVTRCFKWQGKGWGAKPVHYE